MLTPNLSRIAVLVVFLAGIVFWGGLHTAIEWTNAETFCISCHEMRDNVYREYQRTVHYRNRTGVRATCPDCHVPKDWSHMMVRKLEASKELFYWLRGSIDTREKFLAKRLKLAERVWHALEQSDSRECRNCHAFQYMDTTEQTRGASAQHQTGQSAGKTCIDCHKGVAHQLPQAVVEAEHERYLRDGVRCAYCHTEMAQAAEGEWDDLK